jgi:hypothetical protein
MQHYWLVYVYYLIPVFDITALPSLDPLDPKVRVRVFLPCTLFWDGGLSR